MSKQINIKFDDEAIDVLEELKNHSDAESYIDVIRNALGFCHWVLEKQKKNLSFTVVDENGDLVEAFNVFKF